MANITLSISEDVKKQMEQHGETKWSEVAKRAIVEKILYLQKLEILRKYVDKEPFSKGDMEWMEAHDWHPVDERDMKGPFVKETLAARNQGSRKT